jgi:hypothetical protein
MPISAPRLHRHRSPDYASWKWQAVTSQDAPIKHPCARFAENGLDIVRSFAEIVKGALPMAI